jgi:hypothetical protein
MADRQRERVRRVSRPWRVRHPQQPRDHVRHLRLVSAAAARHGGLDLAGRVQSHRQPASGCAHDRHRAGLRRSHDRPHVVLAENPFDGDRIGLVPVQPLADLLIKYQQPAADVGAWRRPDDGCARQPKWHARPAFDHSKAAPGQAGIDPEHPHAATACSMTNMCSAVTLPAGLTLARQPIRRVADPRWSSSSFMTAEDSQQICRNSSMITKLTRGAV